MESEEAVSDTLAFTPIMHYNLFSSIDKYVSQKNKGKEKENRISSTLSCWREGEMSRLRRQWDIIKQILLPAFRQQARVTPPVAWWMRSLSSF